MSNKTYIIGDVHGCYKTLKALVAKLPADVNILFVGDLIDRGDNSKDVIEFVKNGNYDCVRGNHEELLLEYVVATNERDKKLKQQGWHLNGGKATVRSYETILEHSERFALVKSHFDWLDTLPLYLEYKDIKNEDGRYLVVSHSNVGSLWGNRDCRKDSEDYDDLERQAMWGTRFY